MIEAEKQMNRDRDRERGPRSQTQGQRDSDRDNCRSTMEQTQGQAAMDMDWGTQTCRNRQGQWNKDMDARINIKQSQTNRDRDSDMVTWIGIERQGQVVRLRDTNMDRATRTK